MDSYGVGMALLWSSYGGRYMAGTFNGLLFLYSILFEFVMNLF